MNEHVEHVVHGYCDHCGEYGRMLRRGFTKVKRVRVLKLKCPSCKRVTHVPEKYLPGISRAWINQRNGGNKTPKMAEFINEMSNTSNTSRSNNNNGKVVTMVNKVNKEKTNKTEDQDQENKGIELPEVDYALSRDEDGNLWRTLIRDREVLNCRVKPLKGRCGGLSWALGIPGVRGNRSIHLTNEEVWDLYDEARARRMAPKNIAGMPGHKKHKAPKTVGNPFDQRMEEAKKIGEEAGAKQAEKIVDDFKRIQSKNTDDDNPYYEWARKFYGGQLAKRIVDTLEVERTSQTQDPNNNKKINEI